MIIVLFEHRTSVYCCN